MDQFVYALPVSIAPLIGDPFLYAFLQFGILGMFVVTAVRAWRVSPARLRELFTAVIFGLLLEEGDIILFGTYSYNPNWISVGYVPIGIGLTWAMIIMSAMNFSDVLGLSSVENLPLTPGIVGRLKWLARGSLAPIGDAIWAIILDLSLDAVAIRLGLWTWSIPLDRGWFGVPWGNFYAWLFVAASFSFFTRLVRRRERERGPIQGWWQLVVPFLAYGGLLAAVFPYAILEYYVFRMNSNAVWPMFAVTLAVFVSLTLVALRVREGRREAPDHWLMAVRGTMHVLFLIAILTTGIFFNLPILFWVAVAMLAIELLLTYWLGRKPAGDESKLMRTPNVTGAPAE